MIVTEHFYPKHAHFRQQYIENCTERHVNSANGLGHIHAVVVTLNKKNIKRICLGVKSACVLVGGNTVFCVKVLQQAPVVVRINPLPPNDIYIYIYIYVVPHS
jgi:hypothetical protein